MAVLIFPEWFPEGCPPKDAEAMEMYLYRVCSIPIEYNDDWKSKYEKGQLVEKDFEKETGYGLSCLADSREAENLLKLPHNVGKIVVAGTIEEESGVIKATPSRTRSSHYTWWVAQGINPIIYFKKGADQ